MRSPGCPHLGLNRLCMRLSSAYNITRSGLHVNRKTKKPPPILKTGGGNTCKAGHVLSRHVRSLHPMYLDIVHADCRIVVILQSPVSPFGYRFHARYNVNRYWIAGFTAVLIHRRFRAMAEFRQLIHFQMRIIHQRPELLNGASRIDRLFATNSLLEFGRDKPSMRAGPAPGRRLRPCRPGLIRGRFAGAGGGMVFRHFMPSRKSFFRFNITPLHVFFKPRNGAARSVNRRTDHPPFCRVAQKFRPRFSKLKL